MPVLPNKISFSQFRNILNSMFEEKNLSSSTRVKSICYSVVIPRAFCTVLILEVDSFKASL